MSGSSPSSPEIIRQSMMLAVAGAAIGVALAAGVAQLLSVFLYGLSPFDLPSFTGGIVLLAALAVAGSLVPAWVAASRNPIDALRTE
jgi:ABC-type antimicrobial peptide transport system permease subunit